MAKEQLQYIEPVIIGPSGREGNLVYSQSLTGDLARQVYQEGRQIVAKDYSNTPAFKGYRNFGEKTGKIIGSSTFWGIVDDKVLRKQGLWIPELREARKLDELGKLSNRVYRDFGVVVYNDIDYNTEIGKVLVREAKKRDLKLPLVLPFRALDIRKAGNNYGAEIVFADDTQGVISGDEAQEVINSLDYKTNSGVRRLCRVGDGLWFADWDDLAGSGDSGRVDWVCGEATRANLSKKLEDSVNVLYDNQIRELNDRLQSLHDERQKAVAYVSEMLEEKK